MDIIKIFTVENKDFEIRIFGTFLKPLFCAKNVADVLEIRDADIHIKEYSITQKTLQPINTPDGVKLIDVLTEEGLYKMIFRSNKVIATRFQEWIFAIMNGFRENSSDPKKSVSNGAISDRERLRELEDKCDLWKTKYEQMERFNTKKHFSAREIIYLAKMHPGKNDDIYKYGRTSNEHTRRQNYHGQRTEPIEFIDTFHVIDHKRAEGNLKYIIDPHIYCAGSDEIVQMPYHLLKLAAQTAVYIDKIKIYISDEMRNYIHPLLNESSITAANVNEINNIINSCTADGSKSDIYNLANDTTCDNILDDTSDTCDLTTFASDDSVSDSGGNQIPEITGVETLPRCDKFMTANSQGFKIFIDEHLCKDISSKLTRVRLMDRVVQEFGQKDKTRNIQQILTLMGEPKKLKTIEGWRFIDRTVAEFIKAKCDEHIEYKMDCTVLFTAYKASSPKNPLLSAGDFNEQLGRLNFEVKTGQSAKSVTGVLPKEGTLEFFIRDMIETADEEMGITDFVEAYKKYCTDRGLKAYTGPTIKARMQHHGYVIYTFNGGCVNIKGLRLKI